MSLGLTTQVKVTRPKMPFEQSGEIRKRGVRSQVQTGPMEVLALEGSQALDPEGRRVLPSDLVRTRSLTPL